MIKRQAIHVMIVIIAKAKQLSSLISLTVMFSIIIIHHTCHGIIIICRSVGRGVPIMLKKTPTMLWCTAQWNSLLLRTNQVYYTYNALGPCAFIAITTLGRGVPIMLKKHLLRYAALLNGILLYDTQIKYMYYTYNA